MALILVMEDDDGTRMLLSSLLKKQGYRVLAAENGAKGFEMLLEHQPDLVISDVQMPELNGLQMLAQLRRHPVLGAMPVILLTSLQERAVMRAGMNTGADDYITKPFQPAEVFDAVAAQLKKRDIQASIQGHANEVVLKSALEQQKHNIAALYEQRLAQELSDRWPESDPQADDIMLLDATVLFIDIVNFTGLANQLASDELSTVVRKFYSSAGDTMNLFDAYHVQFIGAGMLAVFTEAPGSPVLGRGLRGVRAALGLMEAARGMRHYLQEQFPQRSLPGFDACCALHSGEVTLTTLQNPLQGLKAQKLPVGAAVNAAMLLQKQVAPMGWSVACSATLLRAVGSSVKPGRKALFNLAENMPQIYAAELLGLVG
ncbi:MAG: response regulator [Burkholderiaceae bacterium]